MTIPNNIRTALEADFDDMLTWSSILNYFSSHKSELSLPEKISIYDKCEGFRNFWNTDMISHKETCKNGKIEVIKSIRKGLGIDKKDVYPNDIYTDEELLEHFQTRTQTNFQLIDNNKKLATDSDRDTNSIGKAAALAI